MEKESNEPENNKNSEVNVGKIVTGALALISCAIVFFFNVDVFNDIGYWGQHSFASLIISIITVLIIIATLIVAVSNIVSLIKKGAGRTVSLATVIFEAVASIFLFLYSLIYEIVLTLSNRYYFFHFPILQFVVVVLCVGLMIGCLICNKKFPAAKSKAESTLSGNIQAGQNQADGYNSLTTHVLLMIFLGWIWQLIWAHRITKYLNSRTDFNRNPTTTVLLCLFVPFYSIYWTYKAAQAIDNLGTTYSVDPITTICLICEFFLAIASPIIRQKKINDIIDKENGNTDSSLNKTISSQSNANVADELKKYKQLLDEGAITQEEYDAVKSEYLKEFVNK